MPRISQVRAFMPEMLHTLLQLSCPSRQGQLLASLSVISATKENSKMKNMLCSDVLTILCVHLEGLQQIFGTIKQAEQPNYLAEETTPTEPSGSTIKHSNNEEHLAQAQKGVLSGAPVSAHRDCAS
eukprot:1140355-Pelagomonas_calceolata.AAC.3